MAYQTGTASSLADYAQIVHDFAVAQGWTSNIYSSTNRWMAINNGTSFLQFRWDNANAIAMACSRAFVNTSTAPGNHTDDDNLLQLDASAPYDAAIAVPSNVAFGRRQIRPGSNGPFTSYHLFSPGTTQYIHAILEASPGVFHHMSFGQINKVGTWTGGSYGTTDGSEGSAYPNGSGGVLFGGGAGVNGYATFSLHAEGLPDQDPSGKWMISQSSTVTTGSNPCGNDRAGNPRGIAYGGTNWNSLNSRLIGLRASLLTGFVPLHPIPILRRHNIGTTDARYIVLGYAPDIYLVQMANLEVGQEFTIGSNTYKVFPARQKGSAFSKNMGWAYRKVV